MTLTPVERIQNAIATAALLADECGSALLYHDLHEADGLVTELAANLVEAREQLQVALDALARLGRAVGERP